MSEQDHQTEPVLGPDWSEVQPTATVISSIQAWVASQSAETSMGRDNLTTINLIHGYWNRGVPAVRDVVDVDAESVA